MYGSPGDVILPVTGFKFTRQWHQSLILLSCVDDGIGARCENFHFLTKCSLQILHEVYPTFFAPINMAIDSYKIQRETPDLERPYLSSEKSITAQF